jgi:FKBP-type peptidyl-prolyl cis-trans isomerase FkpA
MKNLFLLFAAAFVLASCNMSYEKTKSGVRYKIIKGKGGEKLKSGDIIKFNQVALIPERDTILGSTYGKMPGYLKIDTGAMAPQYHFIQVLPYMSVGDSAVVILSVDSLFNKGMLQNGYDNVFRKGGQITIRLKVIKKFANEQEMNAEYEKDMAADNKRRQQEAEAENQKLEKEAAVAIAEQKKAMEDYFKKNNINVVKTASGAFVEIKEKGTGNTGDSTMDIVVVYTGKLFKEGTTFDSNAGTGKGLRFSLGQGTVVKGFDEGLMYFAKSGKGKIYIPSTLGYGPRENGPIPANSALIFEVEVHDLQKRTGGVMPMPVEVNLAGAPAKK